MNIRREPPKNPLMRDGVSQGQRQVPALSPDYVKVDEGDLADFLVFAYTLSHQVNYYKDDNTKYDNWQDFFVSTPVQIALISKTRPDKFKDDYTKNLDIFLKNRSLEKPETLKPILATWRQVLQQIKQWYEKLEPYTKLKSVIKGLVKTNLIEALKRIQSFEQAAKEAPTNFYEDFAEVFDLQISPEFETIEILLSGKASQARVELDFVFQALFKNYRQIIQLAPKHLHESLTARQDHPPHLSLYFAFWQVMQPARDDLNRMTQRHLDFFYHQVLRLSDRPAEPDHAHLIFELAKSQTEYKLGAETRFTAGKDASGAELFYKLDAETVLHKAQIASLKGLFLDSQQIATGETPTHLLGFYTSPLANSFDGKGKDFPQEQAVKAWLPFGNNTRDHAQLGLAIACNIFYLREGDRSLIFTLTFDQALVTVKASDLAKIFTVDFSGKKTWITGKIIPPEEQGSETNLQGQTLTLEVNIAADQEPIDVYHPELPGAKFSTHQPVARLQLKDDVLLNDLSAYNYFLHLQLTKLTIRTKEIKIYDLILQNDLSIIDPTKPFQPFGARPTKGAKFYVGSKEVFQKNLSLLKVNILWQGLPDDLANYYRGYYEDSDKQDFSNFSAEVKRLTQHDWSLEGLPPLGYYNLFNPRLEERILVERTASQTPLPGDKIDNLTSFNLQTDSGFLRFLLNQDFLHEEYVHKYAIQTLASAKNFRDGLYVNGAVYEVVTVDDKKKTTSTLMRWRPGVKLSENLENVAPITINEPYTPIIQEIYLKYIAVAEKEDYTLFHLHPFDGFADWDEKQPYFLPQFINEGELLIGLANLEPPTGLSLLFQVVEESADEDLAKTDIHWYYLKDNNWILLSDGIVRDSTNGLITHGIINLTIPEDISKSKTTILDSSLYWIKASVPARSKAICSIIGAHTQAARVTFTEEGNDPNHLAVPLPSGTIAKLAVSAPEIKKVEQPYNSFGGKIKEQPNHFYTRISELLRHKGRAVTIFDYERLVLEKFPEIYKVRCINHGQVAEDELFDELVPGAVTLVVIPKMSQYNISQELEPKVNINLRDQIKKYLISVSSVWADIQVVNPKYEHIRVEFAVKFKSPYNENFGYYSRSLQQEITNFLAPWTVAQGTEIHFGGVVYRSSILNFIEQQYYVDYIVDFKMHSQNQRDVREVVASTARSILTSVSLVTTKQTHIINEINAIKEAAKIPANQKLASGTLGYEALADIILEP